MNETIYCCHVQLLLIKPENNDKLEGQSAHINYQ